MTRIEEVSIGDELPTLEKNLTRPQLFRYSAITWNPHRIHYDPEYAKEVEGHPDVLIQSQFQGAAIQELLMDWLGEDGELVKLSWSNVGRATSQDTLYARAKVTEIDEENRRVRFENWTETDESRTTKGNATVTLYR